jgi:uncharacterized protein YutE (UPF0331/DUF86 family)
LVNKNVLVVRLERLRGYLDILESIQKIDSKRFLQDPFIHGTAERNLHLAIECLLDIGNHVIADKGYGRPESYADIFRILNQERVISDQLYKDLEGMAGFRNVLVHDYMHLDRTRVYQTIQTKTRHLEKLGDIFTKML